MNDDSAYIQLLAEARSGNRAGMGRLAVLVWQRLYPFVLRSALSHDATEDILQETLLAMICGLESLRDNERFWPWIYRIAFSKIQDRVRGRRRQLAFEAAWRWSRAVANDEPGCDDSMLEAKIREETRGRVSAAIEQLSRQHRDLLRLRYYERLPYAEIASLTRTTPEKARVRSHRAKKSLQKRLACCV